jgi:hypothetical protein
MTSWGIVRRVCLLDFIFVAVPTGCFLPDQKKRDKRIASAYHAPLCLLCLHEHNLQSGKARSINGHPVSKGCNLLNGVIFALWLNKINLHSAINWLANGTLKSGKSHAQHFYAFFFHGHSVILT